MQKIKSFILNKKLWFSILLSLPAVWALLIPGFYGASDELHIAWLYEMYTTLETGQFPVRFVPDLSFGFGYPLFNFVFPLPFYIGSLFHLIGFSYVASIKLLFLLSIPLSGVIMYKFLRGYANQVLSLTGSLVYVYTPYRATDIYVRGAIGEIFSFIFFPLVLLSLDNIAVFSGEKRRKEFWIGVGSLAIAGLILSHNISSYMFMPFALIFFLSRVWGSKPGPSGFYPAMLTMFLGLSISAFFWVPAIAESALVKYSTTFDYWDHFPSIRQLLTPYFGYGASVPGPGDGMSFFLGMPNIFLTLSTVLVFIFLWRKIAANDKRVLLWSFFTLTVSFVMMNFRSSIIWKNVPFLPYFQFPWRFLSMTTLCTPIFIITLKYLKPKHVWALVILLVVLSFGNFHPQDFLGRTDDYYLAKYIPYPTVREPYLTQAEEYLRLPESAMRRPDKTYPDFFSDGNLTYEIVEAGRLNKKAILSVSNNAVVSYNKYYFPGWIAKIDGNTVDIFPGEPFGQVSFLLSEGVHSIELTYSETDFRKVINLISFIGLVVVCGLMLRGGLQTNDRHNNKLV